MNAICPTCRKREWLLTTLRAEKAALARELEEAKSQTMLLRKMLEAKNPAAIDTLAKALGSPEADGQGPC